MYDANRLDVTDFPQTILNQAGPYVDTVAWHCYANNVNWATLSTFKESNPNVQQYMTECWTPSTGAWNEAADFRVRYRTGQLV